MSPHPDMDAQVSPTPKPFLGCLPNTAQVKREHAAVFCHVQIHVRSERGIPSLSQCKLQPAHPSLGGGVSLQSKVRCISVILNLNRTHRGSSHRVANSLSTIAVCAVSWTCGFHASACVESILLSAEILTYNHRFRGCLACM